MSKARDYFDDLEKEGISKILEKQRAVQMINTPSKIQSRKLNIGANSMRLADYIRASSGQRQDCSHSSIKKFISSISSGLQSSNNKNTSASKLDQYRQSLAELCAFVKKHMNNEENYHHFEEMLENINRLTQDARTNPETPILDKSRIISKTYLNIPPINPQSAILKEESLMRKVPRRRPTPLDKILHQQQRNLDKSDMVSSHTTNNE